MSIRLQPAQVHLGRFDSYVKERLVSAAKSSGILLSSRARDRLEAAFWTEVVRVAGYALATLRDRLAAADNPFAAMNLAMLSRASREKASALLLEKLQSGEIPLPEGMEAAVRSRLDLLAGAIREMLACLEKNRREICGLLFGGREFSEITDLRIGAGDFHRGARAAAVVFTDAGKLVFKPRDCTCDLRAGIFTARYFPESVILPKCFTDGKTFGVFEYLEKQPAEGSEGARRWFRAMGEAAVLFHILGSRDMNVENVRPCRGLPALIDLETLLTPQLSEDTPLLGNRLTFGEQLMRTPWVSCLLYRKQQDLQISPLFNDNEKKGSLPRVNGRPVNVLEYRDAFFDGFSRAYERCMSRRDELIRDIREIFGDVPFRVIFRDSQAYMKLMERCAVSLFGPDPDAFRASVLRTLQVSGKTLDPGVWEAEYRALLRWDIPWFEAEGESMLLSDGLQPVSSSMIRTGAVQYAVNRIRNLCPEELSLILDSFGRAFDVIPAEKPKDAPAPMPKRADEPLAESLALPEAEELLLDIDAQRVTGADGASGWITFDASSGSPVAAQPGMVYGTTGIGLFACALAGLTDRPEIKAAARSCTEIALDDLRFHFHALKTGALVPAEPDTGEATGFGGYLRCLALMNRLQPGLCTDLIDEGLRLLDGSDLGAVTRADRLLGISGLAGTLVRFPELLESVSGKTVLRRAAERLMALRGFQEGSFTLWRTVSPRHLISGAGHGMAGIAEALYGAGRLLDREDMILAAADAMDYECRAYDPEKGTWPDNRLLPEKGFMHGYCSGAPGIALMQLRAPLPGTEAFPELVRNAVEQFSLHYRDHLCCGNGALVECELSSGRRDSAGRILAGMVERKQSRGFYTTRHAQFRETGDPSLFFGLAGIGYQLLRYAAPERILSVL